MLRAREFIVIFVIWIIRLFLLITDQYSKWLEIYHVSQSSNAKSVINFLKDYFARWGISEVLVTDNGPPFSSMEFQSFMRKNGVIIFLHHRIILRAMVLLRIGFPF